MHYLLIYTKLTGDKILPVLAIFTSTLAMKAPASTQYYTEPQR